MPVQENTFRGKAHKIKIRVCVSECWSGGKDVEKREGVGMGWREHVRLRARKK